MPFVVNQGVRIRYEIEGHGPPLVLHHGFTGRLEMWQQLGYTEHFRQSFKLIMLDSRGHGESDKPHDVTAYALPNRVGDVVAILDELRIDEAHFFGYSMGGWIGFGMVRYALERLNSLVIGGAHPYPDPSWEVFSKVTGEDTEEFLAALETVIEGQVPAELRPLVLENDLQALVAGAQERPSLEDVLARMKMPCLFFVGEADSRFEAVRGCAAQVPTANFVSFPELTHVGCFLRSDLVSPAVSKFLVAL